MHILALFRHFQAYGCIFRTLYDRGILRALAHSESSNIQNPGIYKPNAYLEICQTSKVELFPKIFKVNIFSSIRPFRCLTKI